MSLTPRMLQQRGGGARRPSAGPRWQEFEAFRRGMNQVDARTAIADDEAYWIENMIPIGAGALQILNGPGDAVATISVGIASLWGFTLNGAPVHIAINRDGSVTQVTPGGATTSVATANSVDPSDAVCTIWRGTTILILSPLGYVSWDGTTFTVISTTQTGVALVVGQGRAWLINERTITYTAPNTYNDFTAGNGAGSTILTDEAFDGNVVAAVSALEQIWLVLGHRAERGYGVRPDEHRPDDRHDLATVAPRVLPRAHVPRALRGLRALRGDAAAALGEARRPVPVPDDRRYRVRVRGDRQEPPLPDLPGPVHGPGAGERGRADLPAPRVQQGPLVPGLSGRGDLGHDADRRGRRASLGDGWDHDLPSLRRRGHRGRDREDDLQAPRPWLVHAREVRDARRRGSRVLAADQPDADDRFPLQEIGRA